MKRIVKKRPPPKPIVIPPDDVLYKAGSESELQELVKLVSATMELVIAHVDKVMVMANNAAETQPDHAAFWRGVVDAAYKFYVLKRARMPRDTAYTD